MGDFPTAYRDTRVKRPDFPLNEAIGWYLSDRRGERAESTLRRYRTCLGMFHDWLPASKRVLASLTAENVDRWARDSSHNQHTRMNRIIALKSLAKYLADQKLWYGGEATHPLSVLTGLEQPQPSRKGTPGYTDEEVRTIRRDVPETRTRLRTLAIIAVELHGFRAKEVRTMLYKNVQLPERGEVMGHFLIERREHTKSWDSLREIPMDPAAKAAILRYIRIGRPEWRGKDDEPLFLTEDGLPFTENGWNAMARRMRQALAGKVVFKQHRFRSWRTRQLHAAGAPDSVIIETMGWGEESGSRMLRRYVGRIPLSTLKRATPSLLASVMGE